MLCVESLYLHKIYQNTHKLNLETALSSLLYEKHLRNLESRDLNLLKREHIVW